MLLLLTTFATIFKFSSQIAEESDDISNGVLRKIIDVFPYTKGLSEEIKITLPILAGLPCMSSVAMFANANGADGDYAIGAIFVTTVASMATLPFVSYVIGTVF